jgi:hypothetical protein
MALWGISTASETAANNYALPKHLSENDRNNTPWNCFADCRGWIYRRYKTRDHSGISTRYCDEILIPVTGINSTNTGGSVGIGTAGPVAVFFEDPNKGSPISVGGGATTGIATNTTGYIHVVFNELVFASAGATMRIRTFDANNNNESTAIVAYATSNTSTQYAWAGTAQSHLSPNVYTNFNGQITNRVAFAYTSPSSVLTTNVNFLTTTIGSGVTAGSTNIFVSSLTNVSAGSSISVGAAITNRPVVAIGDTYVTIGAASTIPTTIAAGVAVTFSSRTNATKLVIDMTKGFIGIITDGSNAVGVISSFSDQFGNVLLRNIGGSGTTGSVVLGTTTITVS